MILVGGDSIHIPEYDPIMRVEGAVNSPGAVAYTPGEEPGLVRECGGRLRAESDKAHAYVTQPERRS